RWCEIREPQSGLVSRQEGQRQPRGALTLASPLACLDPEFTGGNSLDGRKGGTKGTALGSRNLQASRASSDEVLDALTEVFAAQEDLRHEPLPGGVSGAFPFRDELAVAATRRPLVSELREGPVHLQPVASLRQPRGRAVIAPRPLPGRLNDPGSNRIED